MELYTSEICLLPPDHDGPCCARNEPSTENYLLHRGEIEEVGIRELAIIDRARAREDMAQAGLQE